MSIVKKFLNLIDLSKYKQMSKDGSQLEASELDCAHTLFYTLCESHNAQQVHKMLQSGYNPHEKNVIKFLTAFSQLDYDYKKREGHKMVELVKDSIIAQREGNPNIFKDKFFKREVGDYYISRVLRDITYMEIQSLNFFKLELNERIKFVAKYYKLIEDIELLDSYFYTTEYKNKYDKFQEIINEGVNEVIQRLDTSVNGTLIAKKVEQLIGNKISPEFQEVISSIDSNMFEFSKTKIEMWDEDRIIIKKIIDEDIPSMVASVALLPVEMQSGYKNIEGVAVKDSLLKLLKSYKKTINSIIDKTINAHITSVDNGLKINYNYIEKIHQTRINSEDETPNDSLKSMATNKRQV